MKKLAKPHNVIFIITICSIFLWLTIFMNYYVIMQADFLKNCQTYEDINLDTSSACHKQNALLWAPNLVLTHWDDNLFKSFNSFYFQLAFIEPNTVKLRC